MGWMPKKDSNNRGAKLTSVSRGNDPVKPEVTMPLGG